MDHMLSQIVNTNTSFEDFFAKRQAGRHQQIVSNLPPGVNLPAPRSPHLPFPVTGRFNNPDEDHKGDTLKLDSLPSMEEEQVRKYQGMTFNAHLHSRQSPANTIANATSHSRPTTDIRQ
jgi:hypothetical protein